jgi:hypothetical protein
MNAPIKACVEGGWVITMGTILDRGLRSREARVEELADALDSGSS